MSDVTPVLRHDPADDFIDLTNHIYERFNPPDDDSTEPFQVVSDAADFIEAQPCLCRPDWRELGQSCKRCRVLGRILDRPIAR